MEIYLVIAFCVILNIGISVLIGSLNKDKITALKSELFNCLSQSNSSNSYDLRRAQQDNKERMDELAKNFLKFKEGDYVSFIHMQTSGYDNAGKLITKEEIVKGFVEKVTFHTNCGKQITHYAIRSPKGLLSKQECDLKLLKCKKDS